MIKVSYKDWWDCVFAWGMVHGMNYYERWMIQRKHRLFGGLEGEVLEIGPGAGVNLQYLPEYVQWTGLEPNVFFHPYIQKEARRLNRQVEVRVGHAEELDSNDDSLDVVIGTLVLCSVEELMPVLREIFRVLKPGGRYYFVEHVAAPRGTFLRLLQEILSPIWLKILQGCRPNQETLQMIKNVGFEEVVHEEFRGPLPLVSPHISGYATKAL